MINKRYRDLFKIEKKVQMQNMCCPHHTVALSVLTCMCIPTESSFHESRGARISEYESSSSVACRLACYSYDDDVEPIVSNPLADELTIAQNDIEKCFDLLINSKSPPASVKPKTLIYSYLKKR